jgi:hypothetical protein
MFERFWSEGPEAAAAVGRICAAARAENRAAGQRLAAIGELDTLRAREHEVDEHWSTDTYVAVSAEVSAALKISEGLAASCLHYARAMRDRLPRAGELLLAGDIDYWVFQTMVFRTDLITDSEVLAAVDATLAAKAPRWPSLTRGRLAGYIDKIVARADGDAVRRRRQRRADREFSILDSGDGVSEVFGRLISTDAHVLDARLDALAATVCEQDPRTGTQRRADALGALAAGAERLDCRCRQPGCSAAAKPVPKPVLIYVIAEPASVEGIGQNPGSLIGADALIPAELLTELARSARLRPLTHPADTSPESGYAPSQALADFVRCRDLTCRFPGCDKPATGCDLDHTIPHSNGGPTHASNLKALCRQHHLVKTFLRWSDEQLPDGTVIWRAPSGQAYVTTPGSTLLFPGLCAPTGELALPDSASNDSDDRCGDRTAMMPKRRRTRAENHARYVAAERTQNRKAREARRQARQAAWFSPTPPADDDDDPPPF